jgi:hypothetical protein
MRPHIIGTRPLRGGRSRVGSVTLRHYNGPPCLDSLTRAQQETRNHG